MRRPLPAVEPASPPNGIPVTEVSTARQTLLEQSAIALGRAWADDQRTDLRREGRPASGGWPGTLREARSRVQRAIPPEMIRRKLPAISEVERELAARTAYASARNEWRRGVEPETD